MRKKRSTIKKTASLSHKMHSYKRALSSSIENPEIVEQLSFHLAEIREEIPELLKLLKRFENGEDSKDSDVEQLIYYFCAHWPYHLKNTISLLKKININQEIGSVKMV